MQEDQIGYVSHYFNRICVAGIVLTDTLRAGDVIRFRGKHTDFIQRATSIQHNHQQTSLAEGGQEVGVLVDYRVRPGDKVFRLVGPDTQELLAREPEDLKRREMER